MRLRPWDKSDGNLMRAQKLRREMSAAERVLWGFLRDRRLGGLKFRRQVAIGPWVADFYCAEADLIVELDGDSHRDERKQLDSVRDKWMNDRGLETLRVTASELSKNPDGVRSTLLRLCRARIAAAHASRGMEKHVEPEPSPLPSPFAKPKGEGDD